MIVKQIDMETAFQLAAKGMEIKVLVPTDLDNRWESMEPDTLQNMLADVLFFRQEPALEKQTPEELFNQEPESPPSADASGHENGHAEKKAGSVSKRKPVDTGKMMALRKAGWSMKKIGEELGISEGSVFNYLKKMEEKTDEV